MSRPVDEKIAKLTLDNKDFTRKAAESMSIFQKLTAKFSSAKKIDMSGSVKSLNDVNTAASKIDLKTLAGGATTVGSKFTAMGAIAVGALMKIGSTAVSVGANLLKSFTMDPITQGFGEYEEKMNAIQVILSNTEGKSNLDDVKASLADLNTYADKTIYSFSDMTKNMGTFTAAGVDLKTAQTAIKGIGNLAAVSGSNTQQAGMAMYQLSQAIAAGKVGLQDWNSVVNAGMGGAKFQNALKANAKGFWDSADATLSFRDSLQEGWLTTDVLMKTLDQFAKDDAMLEAATKVRTFSQLVDTAREGLQSGWATTWELIFGDFKESGDMWTQIGDAILTPIQKSADARNKLISDFNQLGGRTAVITTLKNAWTGLNQVFGVAKDAFHDIFPPASAKTLADMAKRVAEFSKNFKMSGDTANQVKTIFKGVFSIFDSGIRIVKSFAKGIIGAFPKGVGSGALDLGEKIAKLLLKFNDGLKGGNAFTKALEMLGAGAVKVGTVIWNAASSITQFIGELGKGVMSIKDKVQPAFEGLKTFIGNFFKSLGSQDVANIGIIGGLVLAVKKLDGVKGVFEGFLDKFSGLFGSIKEGIENLGGLKDVLNDLQTNIKSKTLMNIAIAVGLLAGSLKLISTIPGKEIFKSLETVAAGIALLVGGLKVLSMFDMGSISALKSSSMLIALGTSVLILAGALKVFSSIKPNELGRGMLALVGTVTTLTVSMGLLNRLGGKMGTSSLQMIALATAVVILTQAVKQMSKIKGDDLGKSIASLGIIFAELAAFLKIVDRTKFGPGSAVGVTILSGAILIMVEGIRQIASIDSNNIVKGLTTIGVILGEVAIFVKIAGGSKVMGAATGMVLVAGAINMLVGPITDLGNMDMDALAQGLIAMGIALTEVTVAMKLASGSGAGAASILVVAAAIKVLVPPLVELSNLSVAQAATGLITLAGAFTIIGVASAVMTPFAPGILAFAAAITAVGIAAGAVGFAIGAFTVALTTLATIGVTGIAAVVGALGLLLDGLIGLIPKLVEFGVTAVTSMVGGLSAAAPQLAESALQLILGFLTALRDYVPQIADVGLELITNLVNAISENLQPLIDAGTNMIVQLVNGMANGLREHQGEMVAAIMNITEAMLEAMITGLQAILDTMFGWIPGFKDTTAGLGDAARSALREKFNSDNIGQIGQEGGQGFVNGVNGKSGDANAAGSNLANNAKSGADPAKASLATIGTGAGANFINNLNSQTSGARNAGANVANNAKSGANPAQAGLGTIGTGAGQKFINSLNGQSGGARGAGSNIGNSAKSGASSTDMGGAGRSLGNNFASGVGGAGGSARSAGTGIGNEAKSGAGSVDASSSGAYFGEGFASGISSKGGVVRSAAQGLASIGKAALEGLLKIFSPSRVMREDGGYFGEGFALGIEDKYDRVDESSTKLGKKAINGMDGVSEQMQKALEFEGQAFLQPVIKPIFDFSNFILPDWKPSFSLGVSDNSPVAPNIEINITTTSNDPTAIANEVEKVIVRRIQS